MSYCVDASSLIWSWNEAYPRETFPTLYKKLEKVFDKIVLIEPIFSEIKGEELVEWLKPLSVSKLTKRHEKEVESLNLIYEPSFNRKEVSPTDIKLIAFAKVEKHTVVTEEKRQSSAPPNKSRYKIPLICKEEKVPCINFLTFLEQNGIKV